MADTIVLTFLDFNSTILIIVYSVICHYIAVRISSDDHSILIIGDVISLDSCAIGAIDGDSSPGIAGYSVILNLNVLRIFHGYSR